MSDARIPQQIDPALIRSEAVLENFLAWMGFVSRAIPPADEVHIQRAAPSNGRPQRCLIAQDQTEAGLDNHALVAVEPEGLCIYSYDWDSQLFRPARTLSGLVEIETIRQSIRAAMTLESPAQAPAAPVAQTDPAGSERNSNLVARGLGLFFLLLGGSVGYFLLLDPLIRAIHGEKYIWYPRQAGGLVPLALMYGLFLLAFGADGMRTLAARPIRPLAALWMIITLILCALCFFGVDYLFGLLGYS